MAEPLDGHLRSPHNGSAHHPLRPTAEHLERLQELDLFRQNLPCRLLPGRLSPREEQHRQRRRGAERGSDACDQDGPGHTRRGDGPVPARAGGAVGLAGRSLAGGGAADRARDCSSRVGAAEVARRGRARRFAAARADGTGRARRTRQHGLGHVGAGRAIGRDPGPPTVLVLLDPEAGEVARNEGLDEAAGAECAAPRHGELHVGLLEGKAGGEEGHEGVDRGELGPGEGARRHVALACSVEPRQLLREVLRRELDHDG